MSQNKFKIGDLVEYSYKEPNRTIKGIGVIYVIHDITDGIYHTRQRFVYEILAPQEERMPVLQEYDLKKIKT